MNNHIIRCVALALVVLTLAACGDNLEPTQPQDPKSTPMTFVVDYPGQTRATATNFERNDRIGLYVADAKQPLELAGNLVNNEALTFDGNKWEAGRTLYWDEGTYNAYAYYPYMQNVTSVTDQPFSVRAPKRQLQLSADTRRATFSSPQPRTSRPLIRP